MWTPRPVSAFRYAGSVATSVLPSPVAISAILPAWSTMPPISCMSKCRMATVRRAASRHTANASGSTSSIGSASSSRFLNSSDFARRAASSSDPSEPSNALIAATIGSIRLTSRSCLVPKIFLSRASIMPCSLYRARSRTRPLQKLARVPARRVGDPLARDHARDFLDARVAGQHLRADARAARAHALPHPHVVRRAGGDRRQMRDAEHLAPLGGPGELLGDDCRDAPADSRVDLVEDHRGHAIGARQNRLEREHGSRELAARHHLGQRTHVLARVGRQAKLDPVEAARPDVRHRTGLDRDREAGPVDPQLAQLALRLAGEPVGGRATTLRERDGGSGELGLQLREQSLLLGQDLLVAIELLELDGSPFPKREHRRFGIPVFPLEPGERVEALVHRLQTPGRHRHALAESSHGRERVLDQGAGAVDRVGGRGECRVESRELTQEAPGTVQPARRRALVLVEQPADLGEPRGQPLGVLEPPALGPQLLLLALPQARAIELRELKAEEILALRSIALRRPRALDLGLRGPMPGEDLPHALAQFLGVSEAVQEIQLARRLQEALVLVLSVDLDEVVTEPLQ